MEKIKINFSKNQKLPEGYTVEWWECVEQYFWVIDEDTHSSGSCSRWDCYRGAWKHYESLSNV